MPAEWSTLFLDIKRKIIELLDYESRCNLRICSASDKFAVDTTKFVADTIKMTEIPSDMSDEKTIIRIDIDTFTIWFIGKDNVTKVDRAWNGELQTELSEIKQENRYDVAKRFIDENSINGLISAKTIEITCVDIEPMEHWKLKCDNLLIVQLRNEHDLQWLRQCRPQFKKLEIGRWDTPPTGLIPHFLNVSECLRLHGNIDMTDDELKQITATNLMINSNQFTLDGFKFTLERFLKNGKKDDLLTFEFQAPTGFQVGQVIPKGLLVKRNADENDPNEYNGLIIGGFTNIHGIQDRRLLTCNLFGNTVVVLCEVKKKWKGPFITWPFTNVD